MRTTLLGCVMMLAAAASVLTASAAAPGVDPAAWKGVNPRFDPGSALPTRQVVYKTVGGKDLLLYIFEPAPERIPVSDKAAGPRPAIVFFHGGAWAIGHPVMLFRQCAYLAGRGMWAFSAQYRLVGNQPGVAPKDRARVADCVEDAKDAVRYVREHANELGVDPKRIAAGGGSAGGHLAAAAAVVPDEKEPPSGKSVSCKPNLLVLMNPALFHPSAQGTLKLEQFTAETPPTIMFYGTNDPMLKDIGRPLQAQAAKLGFSLETYEAEGVGHGFFNDSPWRERTLWQVDRFLAKHGYLQGESTLNLPDGTMLKQSESLAQ